MAELLDFHEQWERLVNKVATEGYDRLSAEQRIWFNAQLLLQAIGNGGLISYYYNSPADTLDDCLIALDTLGAGELRRLMTQVNGLFPGEVPADMNDRNEVISSWPDDGSIDDFLDPIEEKAASEVTQLEGRIVAYIEEHGLGT